LIGSSSSSKKATDLMCGFAKLKIIRQWGFVAASTSDVHAIVVDACVFDVRPRA
jgi:hypothetical protein